MVKQALQKLLVLDGVQSAMIIRKDGTVVGSVESGEGDEEQIAAVVSFVMAESSAMATQSVRRTCPVFLWNSRRGP